MDSTDEKKIPLFDEIKIQTKVILPILNVQRNNGKMNLLQVVWDCAYSR
jgi:hypothetical protein